MSLAGLLTILDDDPQLHEVVSRAGSDTASRAVRSAATLAGEDLIAPPTLRPVLAAALTRPPGGPRGSGGMVPPQDRGDPGGSSPRG